MARTDSTLTLTEHEKAEFVRCAKDFYAKMRPASAAIMLWALVCDPQDVKPISRAMGIYQHWLMFGV